MTDSPELESARLAWLDAQADPIDHAAHTLAAEAEREAGGAKVARMDAEIREGDQVFVRATVRRVRGGQILIATTDDWRHWVAADQVVTDDIDKLRDLAWRYEECSR